MITIIYSLFQVNGAAYLLAFFLGCALIYLAICGLFGCNRPKKRFGLSLIGLLAAEVVFDILLAIVFYHGGEYHNYGAGGGSAVMLFWPAFLIIAAVVTTIINAKKEKKA